MDFHLRHLRLGLAATVVTISTTSVHADTITVCADGCDHTTVDAAIAVANDGDVIQLSAETYSLTQRIDTLGKTLEIRGTTDSDGEPTTTLDGGHTTGIMRAEGGSGPLVLQDLVFANGNAGVGGYGGGLYANIPIDVMNCRFFECEGYRGGGVYLGTLSDNSSFTSTSFQGCEASRDGGGAYLSNSDNSSFTTTSFVACVATGSFGGGAKLDCSDNSSFASTTFEGCEASFGGGASLYRSENSSFTSTSFEGCVASYGGGVYLGTLSDNSSFTSTSFQGVRRVVTAAARIWFPTTAAASPRRRSRGVWRRIMAAARTCITATTAVSTRAYFPKTMRPTLVGESARTPRTPCRLLAPCFAAKLAV